MCVFAGHIAFHAEFGLKLKRSAVGRPGNEKGVACRVCRIPTNGERMAQAKSSGKMVEWRTSAENTKLM